VHFNRLLVIVLVLFSFAFGNCLCAAASDWDETPGKSSKKAAGKAPHSKFVLQGQITHSERLPALGNELQAGANFSPGSIPQARYDSSWFKIPAWFAGTYESRESTVDYIKDYATDQAGRPDKTITSIGQEVHGFQQDAHGDIWHYYVKSGSSKSEQAGQITYNNIDWYGPEYVADDKVVMRVQATSFIVDRRSGIIVDSYRREDLKTYEPAGPGMMKVAYTSKSFDSRGNPRDLQNGHSLHRLVEPFHPCNGDGNVDYRQMFRDFLVSQKMPELIPR
jgi:hypothetical protein